MPSDLQVSNIRDLNNANSAISIASDGQVTIAQNNPTIQLGSNATFPGPPTGADGGHILQVVSTQTNSRAGYSNTISVSTSWQDLMSLSITPSATSSKVLVLVSCAVGVNNYGWAGRILQAGSTVADHLGSSSNSARTHITFGAVPYASNDDELATANYTGLFSPSSESEVTYKVQGAGRAAAWSFNRCEDTADDYSRLDAVSTLTLMEIQG